jgi:hypothetical protein
MRYQDACSVANYKKKIHPFDGNDKGAYGYPDCLTGPAWDAYTKNPFDLLTRKDFFSTISLLCLDEMKDTKMTPPYAITFENLTMDLEPITTYEGRKIDGGITTNISFPWNCVPYGIKNNKRSCNRPLRKPVRSGYHQFHRSIWELYMQSSVPQNS